MKKIITRTAYLLSFLIISTPVYLFLFFDINNYKKEITKYVSAKTNYNFRYEGKFHMSYNGPVELERNSRGLFMLFPPFVKGSAILQTRYLRDSEPKLKQALE